MCGTMCVKRGRGDAADRAAVIAVSAVCGV